MTGVVSLKFTEKLVRAIKSGPLISRGSLPPGTGNEAGTDGAGQRCQRGNVIIVVNEGESPGTNNTEKKNQRNSPSHSLFFSVK